MKNWVMINRLVLFLGLGFLLLTGACQSPAQYHVNEGLVFGTTYRMVYESREDHHLAIKEVLKGFNSSLSTYDSLSVISRVNNNDSTVRADAYFRALMETGRRVTLESNGAFDMTVASLVNAWGFGFKNRSIISQELIDSLRLLVGMDQIWLEGDRVVKKQAGVMVDGAAIAKGYGVDVVAGYLAQQGISNYLVEIGGEVVTDGVNARGVAWRVGVDEPVDDQTVAHREFKMIIEVSGRALATSGNYRNFYIDNGKKYAHTIDPRTGYPVEHSLLSASIIAPTCMEADAYATACMVMGLEASKELISRLPNIEACFIYHTEEGDQVFMTDGFEALVVE
ncbi:MAG: FAD:protein FMN transferase [Bacteroidales bacterium]|nr:FAD:protein FMN transferase [Bacteroidales bacterium]